MNRGIENLKDLMIELNDLGVGDVDKLSYLKARAIMLVRTLFGDSTHYVEDINNISFSLDNTAIGVGDVTLRESAWSSGKKRLDSLLKVIVEEISLGAKNNINIQGNGPVFIVHGHNEEMKQSVARTLENIKLQPIILHEQPDQGRTIIEKFSDYSEVGFAVVLLSPDDIVYSKSDPSKISRYRARQNVIFELGYFIGHLGRNRVFCLFKKERNFEMPSDYAGVIYTSFDEEGAWRFKMIKELKAAGYKIDPSNIL